MKTKRQFIDLVFASPYGLRAEDIPYSDLLSIKAAIDSLAGGGSTAVPHNGLETDIDVTWDDASRTGTITTESFDFNVLGTKYTKTGPVAQQITDVTGSHFIYHNSSGDITLSTTPWDLETTSPVLLVYWNATLQKGIPFREAHTAIMDQQTHARLHAEGTIYVSGGVIGGYTLNQNDDAGISFSMTETVIRDEDLKSTLSALPDGGPYFRLHRVGANGDWYWDEVSSIPVWASGGIITWNQYTGGVWTDTPLAINNQHVCYYVFGVPRLDCETNNGLSFGIVEGQAYHSTLSSAQNENVSSLTGIGAIFQETVPLYKLIYKYSAAGGGSTKSQLVEVQSLRGEKFKLISVGAVLDHQTLSNRAATNAHPATSISTDTTSFTRALTAVEENVQLALNVLDNAVLGHDQLVSQYYLTYCSNTNGKIALSTTIKTDADGYLLADSLLLGGATIKIGTEKLTITGAGYLSSFLTVDTYIKIHATGSQTSNTMVGYLTGQSITGQSNTLFGAETGRYITTATYNTAVGRNALKATTINGKNVAVGFSAGASCVGASESVFIGYQAGQAMGSSGAYFCTIVGSDSASSGANGHSNSFFGYKSGNVAGAYYWGCFFGSQSGNYVSSGQNAILIGYRAGYSITGGADLTSLTDSIIIGANAKASANTRTNEIVIGATAEGNGSNTVTIGNTSVTANYLRGSIYINGTKVIGIQQAHIADPSGGGTQDAEARTAIASILSALETHGLLAAS